MAKNIRFEMTDEEGRLLKTWLDFMLNEDGDGRYLSARNDITNTQNAVALNLFDMLGRKL